ncbi:MAG: hypothetical protein HY286_17910 [Planctomycetes bacterium]|nr:hypothetical protein [Planctomycetota bacterium]
MNRILIFLSVCALAAAGCASSSTTSSSGNPLPKALRDQSTTVNSDFTLPGKRVYAELEEFDEGKRFALVNSGSTKASEVYSKAPTPGLLLKVANDSLMADMCEALRRLEFDRHVQSAKPSGAIWGLSLDVDGNRRTIYRIRGEQTKEQAQNLIDLKAVFILGFSRTKSYQSVQADNGGKAFFSAEDERIKKENEKAVTGKK